MKTILDNKRWVVFYSRTGQEIVDISTRLDRVPDVIVTNIDPNTVSEDILNLNVPIYMLPDRPSTDQYFSAIGLDAENTIVTLHGWLRVVPKEICEQYEIYNGHPGLITKHPELKGFNPQEKAFNLGHFTIGSVVHRVTPEVDEGEILSVTETTLDEKGRSADLYYDVLRETSLNSWYTFLRHGKRIDSESIPEMTV
jgi:folate-dependent phosphoribosylglycinamide formyltransferase PurN